MTHKKTLLAAALVGATLGFHGLAHASPPPSVRRLTWTVSQAHPEGWTQGQPISFLVGVGLSDPRHLWLRDSRQLPDESLAQQTVTGWTKPIGLRLAVRW